MRCWSPYNHFQNERMINNQSIFIYCSNNDCELFPFLSTQLLSGVPTNKIVVATNCCCFKPWFLFKWHLHGNTEETDKCLLLYTLGVPKNFDHIHIKAVDSDIVIIMTAAFRKISSIRELRIEFGKGNMLTLF